MFPSSSNPATWTRSPLLSFFPSIALPFRVIRRTSPRRCPEIRYGRAETAAPDRSELAPLQRDPVSLRVTLRILMKYEHVAREVIHGIAPLGFGEVGILQR